MYIPGNQISWKKCKCLGTMIDTKTDIARRKGLTLDTMIKLEKIFKSHKLTLDTKIRIFDAYVSSIMLYNSELWVLNKQLEEKIDSHQRRLIRKILNIKWPKIIKNDELYQKTKITPWSNNIRERRLRWLGHLLRLDVEIPARIAFKEGCRQIKRNIGRHQKTWIEFVRKDLENSIEMGNVSDNAYFDVVEEMCSNRNIWRQFIKDHIMLNPTYM